MKYKLKPQTGLLVAGLFAATYADACYYQNTSVICMASGNTVDTWNWSDGGALVSVKATADWQITDTSPHLVYQSTGAGGSTMQNGVTQASIGECHGPASFKDVSNHTVSVPDWSLGSIGGGASMPNIWHGASTSGGTCQ